jgi:hypothetical protein
MQDADLFLELAGIAGVFVGFGALIAVRSGGASDPFEVAYMRGVVSMGLLTVIAALVCMVALVGAMARTPEWATTEEPIRSRRLAAVARAAGSLYLLALAVALIVIVAGIAPDLEAAIYFTAVALILLWNAWLLLQLVFRTRLPASE